MQDIFRRRSAEPELGFTLLSILRKSLKPTKGVVGLEVEVEGNKFPKVGGYEGTHKAIPMEGWSYWGYVKDGSLRGKDNAEYVLNKPVDFAQIPDALAELANRLTAHGSVLDDSNRTSVHVHLNCQQFHMNRLASFCALYFCFEEILTEWCGDHRVGNLFCLRAKDAPGIVTKIKRFIQSDGQTELSDGLHYSGLNANALTKFGSLEVRSLRGPTDFTVIQQWVDILERLYRLSSELVDPRDITAQFSAQGPLTFFDTILGDQGLILRAGVSYDDERIRDSMYEGIRLAQDLCYCRDWGRFKAVDVKDDPFGRDMRKISSALAMAGASFDIESAPLYPAGTAISQLQSYSETYGGVTFPAATTAPPIVHSDDELDHYDENEEEELPYEPEPEEDEEVPYDT